MKMIVARRTFLKGGASIVALRAAAPLAGVTVFLSSTPARAWVTSALAIAGTVAGLVAAHNRSDGGVGALLQANNQLVLNAIERLKSLQVQVGEVLSKLDSLPAEIDILLKNSETRRLQTELLGVMRGYAELLQFRDPRISDEQWRRRDTTQEAVKNLYFRLLEARQQINALNLADPATALVAAPLGFVETSLLLLRGIPRAEVDAQIRGVYIRWLDAITDPSRPESSAGYAVASRARLDAEWKAALESPFGQRYGLSPTNTLFACTGVNDFRAAYEDFVPTPCPPQVLSGPSTASPQSSNSANDENTKRAADVIAGRSANESVPAGATRAVEDVNSDGTVISRTCQRLWKYPAHIGPSERLAQDIIIRDEELLVDGRGTGLLQLTITVSPERRGPPDGFTPADNKCTIQSLYMPDGNNRLALMRSLKSEADDAFRDMDSRVARINLERARIAFGVQAMVAATAAREKLISYLRYGA